MGRCAQHAVNYERRGKAVYNSKRWAGLRKDVLRAQPFCQHPGCINISTEVDHIRPLRSGGDPWDRANLQGLCAKHHAEKTVREVFGRKLPPYPAPPPS